MATFTSKVTLSVNVQHHSSATERDIERQALSYIRSLDDRTPGQFENITVETDRSIDLDTGAAPEGDHPTGGEVTPVGNGADTNASGGESVTTGNQSESNTGESNENNLGNQG